jgi:uncharacterized Zn-binding protein involved in type VI secretion
MCLEAARKMDPCVHGGMVKDGSPDTDIGGFAAARWGDGHICPIHPPGRIMKASATVFINKVGAARKLDTIMCMAPATPAPGGEPHKIAAHYKLNPDNEEDFEKVLYADHKGEFTTNPDGTVHFKQEVGAGLVSISKQGETKSGWGGRFKVSELNATASVEGGGGMVGGQATGGIKGEAKASVVSGEVSVYKGPPGDNGKNPYAEVGASGDLLTASASGDVLNGYDGKRIGVGAMGSAGAAVASGEAKARTSIGLGWLGLKDWTIDIRGKTSGSVGSAEIGGGAMAFYDTQEKRFYLQGAIKLAALLGFGLDIDISIGKKFGAPTPPAPAPDAVKMGCSTVFIGG